MWSRAAQRSGRRCHRGFEGAEVIAAFKKGDQTTWLGDINDPLGEYCEIVGVETEFRQGISSMRIESRRHEDPIGIKSFDRRRNHNIEGVLHHVASRAAAK